LVQNKPRHILGLSGGKDSAALALYLRDKIKEIEYFFCDTHKELPETYEFLHRLEARLGKKIIYLESNRGFDHWLDVNNGFLPSPNNRWCTRLLKIEPMEKFVGKDEAYSYIAIRADENRPGFISTKPNIKPVFPFMDERPGITRLDVIRILEDNAVGLPKYYEWRSRSGCYFCFFQRKIEWVRLHERHPDLFKKAIKYEKEHEDGRRYFWSEEESLDELIKRKDQIIADYEKANRLKTVSKVNQTLYDILSPMIDDDDKNFCFVCNI
jgi:3'-phosphoadenosine 5'-phosphosulfate sulfotransferase (PAPS reductase)/FAD synthetase